MIPVAGVFKNLVAVILDSAEYKAPSIAGANSGIGKGLKIEDRKVNNTYPLRSESAKSPRLREKEEENTEQVRQVCDGTVQEGDRG